MRKQLQQKAILTALLAVMGISLMAQTDYILEPAEMEPSDTGFYLAGVDKVQDDGSIIHYAKCEDEYGDSDHRESGTFLGFTFNKTIILPTCTSKDVSSMPHAIGVLQLSKSKYPGLDSAVLGYIITPKISDLVSLTLEVSPDHTPTTRAPVEWLIEYSKDNGVSWEDDYVIDGYTATNKEGEIHVYNSDDAFFNVLIKASAQSPIVLRIMTKPSTWKEDGSEDYKSARLKVHHLKMVASPPNTSALSNIETNKFHITVFDNVISVKNTKIEVFNTLGQKVGAGNTVSVKSGMYIVRTETGTSQKVLVK